MHLQLQLFHQKNVADENGARKKWLFIHVPMTDVWKLIQSQAIWRLTTGLIRVKSLIFVAGKAAVGNLPDLTNLQGITENIQEIGLFNVAFVNELFPDLIIWHCIWKDTLYLDRIFYFNHFFLLNLSSQLDIAKSVFKKVNKCKM